MKDLFISLATLTIAFFLFFISFTNSERQTSVQAQVVDKNPDPKPPENKKGRIKGIVVYPHSTKRVAGAFIFFNPVESDTGPNNQRLPAAMSDGEGNYSTEIDTGSWEVCAFKPSENYLSADGNNFALPSGGKCEIVTVFEKETTTADLMMTPRAGWLEGTILDWKEISLPAETRVVIYRPLGNEAGKWVLTTYEDMVFDAKKEVTPDGDGHFIIDWLPGGDYFLRIEVPGLEPWFYKKDGATAPTPIRIKGGIVNELRFSYSSEDGLARKSGSRNRTRRRYM